MSSSVSALAPSSYTAPPPANDSFSTKVELTKVIPESRLSMAPPLMAEFRVNVLPATSNSPPFDW